MTPEQLYHEIALKVGFNSHWPKTYQVDAETYANCCLAVFRDLAKNTEPSFASPHFNLYGIAIGNVNNGLMFKGTELVLKP